MFAGGRGAIAYGLIRTACQGPMCDAMGFRIHRLGLEKLSNAWETGKICCGVGSVAVPFDCGNGEGACGWGAGKPTVPFIAVAL